MESYPVTGVHSPCAECRAPVICVNGTMEGRVSVSRNGDRTLLTPHSESCTTGTEADHDGTRSMEVSFFEVDSEVVRLFIGGFTSETGEGDEG